MQKANEKKRNYNCHKAIRRENSATTNKAEKKV